MTNIAHLSDLHLLERAHARRRGKDRLRLSLLTLGRTVDDVDREARFAGALRRARAVADHLVISGDLTEDGIDAQFERLALTLHDSPWKPHEVTIVPGNHDAYSDGAAWSRALAGPLASFAPTSEPGAVVLTREAVIVAVSTAMPQSVGRAAGRIGEAQLARIRRIGETHGHHGPSARAIVLVQHHGPEGWGLPRRILDGLVDEGALRAVMHQHRAVHVLCGHTHRSTDRALDARGAARIFTAPSVMSHPAPLRLYRASEGRLSSVEHAPAVVKRDAARLLFRAMQDASPAL